MNELEIIIKDPGFPNYDSECACGMVYIWNSKNVRMYKECPEHKKESLDFVQSIVDSINSGRYPLLCRTHNILMRDCEDKENCKLKTEVIPITYNKDKK